MLYSVRSTNVYEERSLGVFADEDEEEEKDREIENNVLTQPGRVAVWGKYLASHARKQLSFGTSQYPSFAFSLCLPFA
jgi:hypothetical protein